jgi:hypothetical protein
VLAVCVGWEHRVRRRGWEARKAYAEAVCYCKMAEFQQLMLAQQNNSALTSHFDQGQIFVRENASCKN